MKRFPILDTCARIEGHPVQYEKLRTLCANFTDWDNIVEKAVHEGLVPLLHRHLSGSEADYPRRVHQTLTLLVRQQQNRTRVHIQALKEIITSLQRKKLTPIVLKGAALCHTTYPDPALRPMRDIDILFRQEEAQEAQKLLLESGFTSSHAPRPFDHYHLPALETKVEGVPLCLELHTGLYPDCPPYYPAVNFEKILQAARTFQLDDADILTMGDEDTLFYVFQHGFRMPLTYEPFKLINAADLIGFIEKYSSTLNWAEIKRKYPDMYNALPLFHQLTPLDSQAIAPRFLPTIENSKSYPIIHFTGWPKVKIKQQKELGRTLPMILKETFFPPAWWFKIYYGVVTRRSYLESILLSHPRHVFWWIKMYASFLGNDTKAQEDAGEYPVKFLRRFRHTRLTKLIALLRKFKGTG